MIDIIKEVRESSEEVLLKDLDMRIGIHTGRVVAGIIGSKVVRYDIFGDGVLIANKMETHGIPGRVCISEETRRILMSQPDIVAEYQIDYHKMVELKAIDKKIKAYIIDRKEIRESTGSHDISSNDENSMIDDDQVEDIVGYNGSIHKSSSDGEEPKKKVKKNSRKVHKSKEKDQNLNDLVNAQDSDISEKIQGDKHNFRNSLEGDQSQDNSEDDKQT